MPDPVLDLSNVISVTVQSTNTGLGVPNINTACLFSKETPSPSYTYKLYTDPVEVATDFGSSSDAAAIANAFFAQNPNPLQTGGYLAIVPLTAGTEKVHTAIARVAGQFFYFGVLVDQVLSSGTDLVDLCSAVQALDKMLFYASDVAADYAPGGPLDDIRTASQTHCRALFYDGADTLTQEFAAAYCARLLSTDFSGSRTVGTLHLQPLANVTPDTTITQTNLTSCQTAGVDVYVNLEGLPCVFTSGANQFVDEVYNEFWFKFALQVAGFNFLRQTSTKIPQTEVAMEAFKGEYRKVCEQAVRNGFLAPGAWTSSTVFGDPEALIRSVKDIGYYVYSQPVSDQLTADRLARKAPLVQIAAKAAGAVHKASVIANINL